MKVVLRGCLELIIVWSVVGWIQLRWLETWSTQPGPLWGAVIGGFLTACAWGLMRNAIQARQQVNLIRRGARGDWPQDGAPFAAVGPAIALDEPLQTPFQGIPCVMYSYELSRTEQVTWRSSKGSRTENRKTVFLSGLAMTKWAVRCPAGEIRVLGFPIPDQFPENGFPAAEYAEKLRTFSESTEFTRVGKWEVGKLVAHARSIFGEGQGEYRDHLKFDGADQLLSDPRALRNCTLLEQFIPLEEPVCALGRYEIAQAGLMNDWSSGGLQVFPGDAMAAARRLKSRWRSYAFFASILALLGTAGTPALLALRERSALSDIEQESSSNTELIEALDAADPDRVIRALELGASLDILDQQERTPLLAAIDRGHDELAWTLLEAGADFQRPQRGWNRTAIESAFDRGDREMLSALESRGAVGVYVTKDSGRPVTHQESLDFEKLLVTYSRALQERSSNMLSALTDGWPEDFMLGVERGLFVNTRPSQWNIQEGYSDGQRASVIAVGSSSSGIPEQYVISFTRKGQEWKIRRVFLDEGRKFQF